MRYKVFQPLGAVFYIVLAIVLAIVFGFAGRFLRDLGLPKWASLQPMFACFVCFMPIISLWCMKTFGIKVFRYYRYTVRDEG